ncbi:MAG: GIY-YIG nuclease family protein [Nitrospirota bacterium]|nr:GIY-YIG nuclease family protein [Nitrospirota bacterium]
MYYVYILHSQQDNKFYTGYTNNLQRRIEEHEAGNVESTKNRRPLKLIYYEAYTEKEDAQNREVFLKSGSGKRYLKKQLRIYFEKNGLI